MAASGGQKFALDLSMWAKKGKINLDAVVRKVVLDLGTRIIMRSPVRTGRFRGNWQYGESVRPKGTVLTVDKSGALVIAKLQAGLRPQAAGKVHWLTNNLPYAQALEYGHSKQAPSGMVGVSIVEYQTIVRDAAKAVHR